MTLERELKWDADRVRRVRANPVYVGVGPYPALTDRTKWVNSFTAMVDEIGLSASLHLLLDELQHTRWTP